MAQRLSAELLLGQLNAEHVEADVRRVLLQVLALGAAASPGNLALQLRRGGLARAGLETLPAHSVLQRTPLWEPLPAAGAPHFRGVQELAASSGPSPALAGLVFGEVVLGSREVGTGPELGRLAMVPFLRAWLRRAASGRCQHPGPRCLPAGRPAAFAGSVLLLAALLEASSWHLPLEVHLGSLSLDEEDGLLFLDSSVPNRPPPQRLRAGAPARPRGPGPGTLSPAPRERRQREQCPRASRMQQWLQWSSI